jgi:branched-chain amino acid transport system ATP-binding protein
MAGGSKMPSDPLLTIEHLTMRFGGLTAVDDLSFEARRGDITALIGPNGAGKTTVFNCITGFYRPSAGRLVLSSAEHADTQAVTALTNSGRRYSKQRGIFLLERMPDQEIAREARVARTFQNIRLFTGMTVLENLIVGEHNALMRASGYSLFGLFGLLAYRKREAQALDHARFWLDRIGLTARADNPAGALPYGAQRRLEIARAMMSEPTLLCLDEPAAGLNPRESAELNELLRSIRDEQGTSILLIEHDMSVVMEISDHVVVLDYGEKIADGPPDEIRNDARVIAAYLGIEDEGEVEEIEAALAAGQRR